MRTGVRIMEDRVSPGSLTASLPKQRRNFGRINFEDKSQDGGENGEAGLAGGLQGTRVTPSVMRRAIWGAKRSLPEVLQPRQNPERKLSLHLALIRSNFPSWIQEDPPPKINPNVRGFPQLQCGLVSISCITLWIEYSWDNDNNHTEWPKVCGRCRLHSSVYFCSSVCPHGLGPIAPRREILTLYSIQS